MPDPTTFGSPFKIPRPADNSSASGVTPFGYPSFGKGRLNGPRKFTTYQCLDGAVVIGQGGDFFTTFHTLDEALSKYVKSPVIKLEDMTMEMVEWFRNITSGVDVLEGISPNAPTEGKDMPYKNSRPASYSYTGLVAMLAADILGGLNNFGGGDRKDILDKLLHQIVRICLRGTIYPYE